VVIALTECSPGFCERVQARDVAFISLHKPMGHGLKLYPALYRLFRDLRPSIVHTRNLAALEASVPAWLARVPVRVHGEHGWDVSDPDGTSMKFRLMRKLYRPFVTHYIALSEHLLSYLTSRIGVSPDRATRICNGVDVTRFFPAREGRALLEGSPFNACDVCVVGTVGRLQAIKDQINLVRGFALLLGRSPDIAERFRLAIAGDGGLRGEIEAEIARSGLANKIWLAGERRDVPEVMRSLDLFVLPSRAEGISNTILEAMASGLPVIATRVGGNAELVRDGVTGLLVPARDPAAIADALMKFAQDDNMVSTLGSAGRRRAEQEFSMEVMVQRYADLYGLLLDAARKPALAY
jgi:sugar transferase (PEP-CTERM/EpsH1 system associated)